MAVQRLTTDYVCMMLLFVMLVSVVGQTVLSFSNKTRSTFQLNQRFESAALAKLRGQLNRSYYWHHFFKSAPKVVHVLGILSVASKDLKNLTFDPFFPDQYKFLQKQSFFEAVQEFVSQATYAYEQTSIYASKIEYHMRQVAPGIKKLMKLRNKQKCPNTVVSINATVADILGYVENSKQIAVSVSDLFRNLKSLLCETVIASMEALSKSRYLCLSKIEELGKYEVEFKGLKALAFEQLISAEKNQKQQEALKHSIADVKAKGELEEGISWLFPVVKLIFWISDSKIKITENRALKAINVAQSIYLSWDMYVKRYSKEEGFGDSTFATATMAMHDIHFVTNKNYPCPEWNNMNFLINQSKSIAFEIFDSGKWNNYTKPHIMKTIKTVQTLALDLVDKLYLEAGCEKEFDNADNANERVVANLHCDLKKLRRDGEQISDGRDETKKLTDELLDKGIGATNAGIGAKDIIKLLRPLFRDFGDLQKKWNHFTDLLTVVSSNLISVKLSQLLKEFSSPDDLKLNISTLAKSSAEHATVISTHIAYYCAKVVEVYQKHLKVPCAILSEISASNPIQTDSNAKIPNDYVWRLEYECNRSAEYISDMASVSDAESKAATEQSLKELSEYLLEKRKKRKKIGGKVGKKQSRHDFMYLQFSLL